MFSEDFRSKCPQMVQMLFGLNIQANVVLRRLCCFLDPCNLDRFEMSGSQTLFCGKANGICGPWSARGFANQTRNDIFIVNKQKDGHRVGSLTSLSATLFVYVSEFFVPAAGSLAASLLVSRSLFPCHLVCCLFVLMSSFSYLWLSF